MALLSPGAIKAMFDIMMPWSAPHPDRERRLTPLKKSDFLLAGYTGIFKKGDIVFAQSRLPNSQETKPAIYAVQDVMEWSEKKGFQIFWRLVLVGGYGPPVVALYYQHPMGENPQIYTDTYFKDYGHGSLPRLNYYTHRLVEGGKTVWDVEDRLRG
jgi:hypothetical protein